MRLSLLIFRGLPNSVNVTHGEDLKGCRDRHVGPSETRHFVGATWRHPLKQEGPTGAVRGRQQQVNVAQWTPDLAPRPTENADHACVLPF